MPAADHSIIVKDLVKEYEAVKAVQGVSFSVPAGSMFAFLGPNGAGKTTTIKMLTTLVRPTAGSITVNGYDPVKNPEEVRHSFGIVFQDPSLDDELTAYENLFFHAGLYGVPRAETPGRVKDMMDFVELWDRKDHLVKTFSGGMKRRLEIARGLLHTPAVLFLDEPTTGLDPQTRNHIWEYIKKLNDERGLTVFFTTHYMEEAERVAKHVSIIDHGKIVADGTAQSIIQSAGTASLEDAFIKLTGRTIREEEGSGMDQMRNMRRMWRGGKR
ncbi:MAG: ATP-binding cassette domain-containing protein [Patescibacteria group bacterium]|nr:ATP-binding cassette domain-containing protein [Patescibacteria group bacterium]